MSVQKRTLGELLPELANTADGARAVGGISADSRTLQAGDVFIALRGERHDGTAFLGEAARRGASLALLEQAQDSTAAADAGIETIVVDGLSGRVGEIAARFFGDPSAALAVVGVTGTNGKTTCTQLIAQAFTRLGMPCGVIGTLGWGFPGALEPTAHTTPDALSVQRMLAELGSRGAVAVAMEVSSHALKQARVRAVRFDTAVFTNLTHDHLDYHGSFEDYGDSKRALFDCDGLANAVVNVDDPFGRHLLATLPPGVRAIGCSIGDSSAALHASEPACSAAGLAAAIASPWGSGTLATPLLGRFNLHNALAALGVLCLHGVPFAQALAVFAGLAPVPGRMQRLLSVQGPLVIVDYAHTPDALEQALRALRQHCTGRLWCVFGCGGERDRMKRPLMGRIAWEHADEVVITSDNPRGEKAESIIAGIATGIPEHGAVQEPDRAAAIRRAIAAARPGDCVLIAGKGHELYQEVNGVRTPFSDAAVAREALDAWSVAT